MRIYEFEVGILVMIEFDFCPTLIGMTFSALDATVTLVNIIQIMAEVAVFRCVLVSLVHMTILTTNVLVIIPERKIGFVMIEKRWQPSVFYVAIIAMLSHPALVRIIPLMAVNTLMLGQTIKALFRMTAFTIKQLMGPA